MKKGYTGKYHGEGTAVIKAPIPKGESKKPIVKMGNDLRTGKK